MDKSSILLLIACSLVIGAENESTFDEPSNREERSSSISCVQVSEPYKPPYTVCGVAVPAPGAGPPYGSVTHIETLPTSYSHSTQVIPSAGAHLSYGSTQQIVPAYGHAPSAYGIGLQGYGQGQPITHEATHISHVPAAITPIPSSYISHNVPAPAIIPVSNYGHSAGYNGLNAVTGLSSYGAGPGISSYGSSSGIGSYGAAPAISSYGSGPAPSSYGAGSGSALHAITASHLNSKPHYRTFDPTVDLMTSEVPTEVMMEQQDSVSPKNRRSETSDSTLAAARTVDYPQVPVIPNVLPTLPIPTVSPASYHAHPQPPQYGHSAHPLPVSSYGHYNLYNSLGPQDVYGYSNTNGAYTSLDSHAFDVIGSQSNIGYGPLNVESIGASAAAASHGAPAVGVFGNSGNSPCAIPFQVSCSPNIVRGTMVQQSCGYSAPVAPHLPISYQQPSYHKPAISVPYAYRASNDQVMVNSNTEMKSMTVQPSTPIVISPSKQEETLIHSDSPKTVTEPSKPKA